MDNEEVNNEPVSETAGPMTTPEQAQDNGAVEGQDNTGPELETKKSPLDFVRGNNGDASLNIVKLIEDLLPAFIMASKSEDTDEIIMHSDAFGDTFEELILLGSAIKFATLHDKNITIVK